MIGGVLAWSVFASDAGAGSFLNNLQQAGFFSYVIPFLLIFALVFGILNRMGMFKENKAVSAIIALSVGLMALQFDLVPKFFADIFPVFGIALSVILVIIILLGLFIDPKKPGLMYTLFGIAAVIALIVIGQSISSLGVPIGQWISANWGSSLVTIFIVGAVIVGIAVIVGKRNPNQNKKFEAYGFMPVDKAWSQ